MSSELMDRVFGTFDDSDPTKSGGGNPFINGHSVNQVEVRNVKLRESKVSSKVYFVVEYVVRVTNSEDVNVGDIEYAWVHDLTNTFFGMSNCKQFMCAAVGIDPKSEEALALGKAKVIEAIADDQPLTGCIVTLTTKVKARKDGAGDFTIHEWSPAAEAETAPPEVTT